MKYFRSSCTTTPIQPPRTMYQTGFKNKTGRTQDFLLYTQERIILDMQNKDIQLSDTTNEEEKRGSAGRRKARYGTAAAEKRRLESHRHPEEAAAKASPEGKKKSPTLKGPGKLKRRLPTLPLVRSTIGVTKLNFSVRNGKRWNLRAIVT